MDLPYSVEMSDIAEENNHVKLNDLNDTAENAKRIWFVPILDFASFRLYPYLEKRIKFREGCIKSTCSLILVLLLFVCFLLQTGMLFAYVTDMVFRLLLFMRMNSGYNASNSSTITSLILPGISSRDEKYHEFQNWFLFIWDYMYGLIGLYSTVFLFLHAWNKGDEFPGIFELIQNITKHKREIRIIQPTQRGNITRFMTCITCSNNQMQTYLDKIGWGISHFCIILLSLSLVVYWVLLNAIGSTVNDDSKSLLSQDSDLALTLAIFDCFHWHLSPVIVCFLIRISCMEITTTLDKLRYEFAIGVRNVAEGMEEYPVGKLWSKFYSEIERVNSISMKYRRISAINIIVLIFAVVGLSLRYINKDVVSIDQFITYDWLDFIRFFTWYFVHLLSVWFMIDAMSTLNQTVDYFSDDIFLLLACKSKFKVVNINEDVKTQLDICNKSKQRFSIDLFGDVTPTTVHLVIGFGSATTVIFISEALKILIENYTHL